MKQNEFQAIQNMLRRYDELTDSINLIVGPQMLMRECDYQATEKRIDDMKTERAKVVQTMKGIVVGNRMDFWK